VGFKFKHFTIEHDACAMKVGTDSIMLGSWVETSNVQRILDVGTGSGLLGIMLAQKAQHTCLIDGIDIDSGAISQAKKNAENCPWADQLSFYHTSLQLFPLGKGYDLIVSNPPYFPINVFANKTQSSQNRRNARQTIELDHATLLQEVTKHLSDDGQFCCVLPANVVQLFKITAESVGLYCTRELQVQAKDQAPVKRFLLAFSRDNKANFFEKMSIYNNLSHYSDEYIALCKDYYLNF
jgi:tRNA1Val (adenine37-N6)-methyltransferase